MDTREAVEHRIGMQCLESGSGRASSVTVEDVREPGLDCSMWVSS